MKHLIPLSDWYLVSPYNITPKSYIKVKIIKEMIVNLFKLLIVRQILLVSLLGSVLRTV